MRWWEPLWNDRFKRYTVFVLLALGLLLLTLHFSRASFGALGGEPVVEETLVTLPFLGEVDAVEYSLPVLAVVLGLVDGFNPCAMWVLVYLISVVAMLHDKRKTWLLVGSFVLASGILYFLFMTAWLNVFLLVGLIRPVTILIGLFALYLGVTSLHDYYTTEVLQCGVGDAASKRRTTKRIDRVVNAPLSVATVAGITALAFVVNSIEFVCSSALPAVYAHVLALSGVGWLAQHLYILLYVLFFMLDDLLIFGLAAFAIHSSIGQRYAKWCRLIGGLIMLVLGLIMLFFPSLLQ